MDGREAFHCEQEGALCVTERVGFNSRAENRKCPAPALPRSRKEAILDMCESRIDSSVLAST